MPAAAIKPRTPPRAPDPPAAPDTAREAAQEAERLLREGESAAASAPRDYIAELQNPTPDPARIAALARLVNRTAKALADDLALALEIRKARESAGDSGGARTDAESRELVALRKELVSRRAAAEAAQNLVHETAGRIDRIHRAATVRSDALALASRLEADLLRRIAVANT